MSTSSADEQSQPRASLLHTVNRPAKEEIAKRAAEAGAGLAAAAQAVGLEDHRRMLRDASKRLRDGHRAMMRAAGQPETSDASDGDMGGGNIYVTGDIDAHPMSLPWAPPPPKGMPTWLKVLAGVALTGIGTAGIGAGAALAPTIIRSIVGTQDVGTTSPDWGLRLVPGDDK